MTKKMTFSNIVLLLGILFLYLPLVIMVIFSFTNSALITVWGGFSTVWYKVLFQDSDIIASALRSLKLALCAATGATILGTMAAYTLTRFNRFRGRGLFYGMTLTPLVMPDVVIGISLLLMFVSLQALITSILGTSFDIRGFFTILAAHITFCTAYVSIIMQSRLAHIDRSIEEAAMDLGAKPAKTFFSITLPQIIPSLIAAWLLAFTLSLDDLVITEFVASPNQSTLPMYIYSTVKTGPTPEINALATIIIGIVMIAVLIATLLSFHFERLRKKDRLSLKKKKSGAMTLFGTLR
ncbi:ABC transporter permease subunit [Thiotrichales bacterium 19S11-10]|nr:ABC transporter permease subunit [Thiotrichales bacterium 19S11-10]MCF6807246.1 ABC transporter permease subunit [Thiotrichales bacterium 19S9-11]MCF6811215.1 ABC transporter permease subunit [Thiotrichales bacterium 19S9-12]